MSKLIIGNLALVLTEKCNFNCQHCMRGGSVNKSMLAEVMHNTFKQITAIDNLTICGGEPLIDYELLKLLVQTIISSKVIINQYSLVTNGTCYTEEIEHLLSILDEYVEQFSDFFRGRDNNRACGSIAISWDDYHAQQFNNISVNDPITCKKYVTNFIRLSKSKYFVGYQDLNGIFNVGNAQYLECDKIELKPIPGYCFEKDSLLYYGPLLTVLTDGTISECDGVFDTLREEYNYGNINNDTLEDIIRNHGISCKSFRNWNKKQKKILKWYNTYK